MRSSSVEENSGTSASSSVQRPSPMTRCGERSRQGKASAGAGKRASAHAILRVSQLEDDIMNSPAKLLRDAFEERTPRARALFEQRNLFILVLIMEARRNF